MILTHKELIERREGVARAMRLLTERERHILRLRFGFDTGYPITLQSIADALGVTKERVGQIIAKALRKLYGTRLNNEDTKAG